MNMFLEIPHGQLVPPPEPLRATMTDEGMDDLVESIRLVGVLFPLIVTLTKDPDVDYSGIEGEELIRVHLAAMSNFEIIDGHRRWMACQRAGVVSVWCNVFLDVQDAKHAMMLHSNIFREDVTPAEEGWQFLELANKYQWSLEKLMRTFKVSENYINDRVELVSKDQGIAQAVHLREINLAQAHELLRERDPERRRTRLLLTKEHGYNARELRVMRQNLEKEIVGAQQELMPHTPEFATPPPAAAPKKCLWCGSSEDPDNMREIPVHWYHEREVRAVCDQVGIKHLVGDEAKK
jgi:ParB family transcriptional regulator, chromosome partitioning protein